MAATAKKGQNVYAPSRVYSYSRAATAEKLPYEEAESIPAQIPRAEPKRHAAPQTRIMREATTAQKRKQRTLPKLISVTGVLMIAAVMIGLVFRYASIARKNKKKYEVISMQIHGLNKTTLLDYPGHVAATVFCGGCNFRCPFCHNS